MKSGKIIAFSTGTMLIMAMVWVFIFAKPCTGPYKFQLGGEKYFLFECIDQKLNKEENGVQCIPKTLVIEAKNYIETMSQNVCFNCAVGNGEHYGSVIGKGYEPHRLTYQVDFPCTASYKMEVEYASNDANRGFEVTIDDDVVINKCCNVTTGGWHTPSLSWKDQGVLNVSKGLRKLSFYTSYHMPHIMRIRFINMEN